jgi:hypothetical protein
MQDYETLSALHPSEPSFISPAKTTLSANEAPELGDKDIIAGRHDLRTRACPETRFSELADDSSL